MSDMQAGQDRRTFFFDISSLIGYVSKIDRYSGIQRVVVTMIVEMSRLVDADRLYLSWRDRKSGRYLCLPFSEIGAEAFASPESMRRIFRPSVARRDNLPPLKKYRTKPVKYYLQRTWLDVAARLGHDRRFHKYNMSARMWRDARKGRKQVKQQTLSPVEFSSRAHAGDHLVLLDSAWFSEQIDIFLQARKAELVVHSMVYDLIPIVAPHTCDGMGPANFYQWLMRSQEYTDHYLAISQATLRDLKDFFSAHDVDAPATVVPLAQAALPSGADMGPQEQVVGPLSANIATAAYPGLRELITLDDSLRHVVASPFVLCVGTIEARKNVWRIALAWKALLDQGYVDLPKLVFAGRRGWLRQDFEDLLAATGNIYGYVRVIDGPSDEELDMLYSHCQFSIMASLYEGWGLPVGEALAYGKTAVVANNSSLPEVGEDLVEYCDATQVSSIAEAAKRLLDADHRAALEAKIAAANLRDWADVARDLHTAVTTAVQIEQQEKTG